MAGPDNLKAFNSHVIFAIPRLMLTNRGSFSTKVLLYIYLKLHYVTEVLLQIAFKLFYLIRDIPADGKDSTDDTLTFFFEKQRS